FLYSSDPAPIDIFPLSLHDALPIYVHHVEQCIIERSQIGIDLRDHVARQKAELFSRFDGRPRQDDAAHLPLHQGAACRRSGRKRSEEHTSELQSLTNIVYRLLLAKK